MTKADYIILGAGASGLMLAYRMANDAFFDKSSIIIIDKEADKGNDRTWCYWEKGSGEWDNVLAKKWDSIYFGSEWFSREINLGEYQYKMIRSKAFYAKLWKTINAKSNIRFFREEVSKIEEQNGAVQILTADKSFEGKKVFNSLRLNNTYQNQEKYPILQQHFIGWFIKTESKQFNENIATFMDFDVPQQGNTRFMYVLPTSPYEALIEYTLFSKSLLPKKDYENAITAYLKEKNIEDFTLVEKEQGAIPMTTYEFVKENTAHIFNIGTAGGWTKASTGYTFRNTTKKTKQLVEFLKSDTDLKKLKTKDRFWFYDLLMIDVLYKDNAFGAKMFSSLFKKSKTETIFRFLDEESHVLEEVKIMSSVPSWRFIKALFNRMI